MYHHSEKKYVVTGGAGFIGTHLVRALCEKGAHVRVIDDLRTGRSKPHLENVTFYNHSVEEPLPVEIFEGTDAIFHLAAIPGVPISIEDPVGTHKVNLDGTLHVLEAARVARVPRVIFSSSAAVYGIQESEIFREDMDPKPMSPYAFHKYAGERMLEMWRRVYGLESISLRYFNVYGSGMDPRGAYAAVIGKFLQARSEGKVLTVIGDGTQTRDFVHVDDVVQANMRAVELAKVPEVAVFNVGTGVGVSVQELAELIGGPIEHTAARLEIQHAVADITNIKHVLGYEPHVSLEDGLKALAEEFGVLDR